MPSSSKSGKASIKWVMSKIPTPKTALDIGCGEGTYAKLFPKLEWTGVEIWEPYVERYGLKSLYKNFYLQDARGWDSDDHFDVCFLGDVLEHMTVEEAQQLFIKCKRLADTVIISIPLGPHPQGAWGGNPHETHVVEDWSDADVRFTFGEPTWHCIDHEIGVYVYSNSLNLQSIPKIIHVVWVGNEQDRPDKCIDTWREKNPDWQVKVWGNKEFNERDWVNKDHMNAVWRTQIYGVADMMRYEILYEEGGFCIDADSICEQPIDEKLFCSDITFFYENEKQRPGLIANGYMAAMPRNEFFKKVSEDIKKDASVPSSMSWIATGPQRLTDSTRKYAPEGVRVHPSHLFMPEHYSGEKYEGTDKIYGRQNWSSTKKLKKLKICVYAISKNEEKFVKRFCDSAKDADYILIADTGSTDRTADLGYECGAVVHDIRVYPWRFDVARNAALALVPEDIDVCVSMDLDEVLEPGWREEIERLWTAGTTRLHHQFDFGGGLVYNAERIHARLGYSWKHICHERAAIDPRLTEVIRKSDKILMSHHPDPTKSRGQYMDLLEIAVKEDPSCFRNRFYYARELYFHRRWSEAISAFSVYLDMPGAVWDAERAYATRIIGRCHAELGDLTKAETWYYRAAGEAPNTREPWCDLAMLMYRQHRWEECVATSMRALRIKDRQMFYTSDPAVWGFWAHDLASIAAWHLGLRDIAIEQAKLALEHAPHDVRLQDNLKWCLGELSADKAA